MIKTVADLLRALADKERQKLDAFPGTHGPTIGSMYEGLAQDILERAIPSGLDLTVCGGVITDGKGNDSGQIDCMLILGAGDPIPYTSFRRCHVRDVIAVLEIKKTLDTADLLDGFEHLRKVHNLASVYVGSDEASFDLRPARRAFSLTTKVSAPEYEDAATLPFELETIYRSLMMEQVTPIRILWGFHGWKKEATLRANLYKNLKEKNAGFGTTSFPQLIVGGKYSLIKANGLPYVATLTDKGEWPFYCSSHANPVRLLLELIWTKLANQFKLFGPWGDDQQLEPMNIFLLAKPIPQGGRTGWSMEFLDYKERSLASIPDSIDWEPARLTLCQYLAIQMLSVGNAVVLSDPELLSFLESEEEDVHSFREGILATGLVAVSNDELRLTTDLCLCVALPSGEFVAAENNTGRLTAWIDKNYPSKVGQQKF